jgi:hypothetical protein
MKTISPYILSLAVLVFSAPSARAVEKLALEAAIDSIQSEQLQRHVNVLADDSFEGREAGSRGGRAAGTYLLKQLREYGLQGGGPGGGYVQVFRGNYRNLLAVLPGSDPDLKEEVIVLGAHYDHVGYGTRRNSKGPVGYVHNGADDNASGTSGLLEVAEALCSLPTPPRRTVLFAFWDGEEKGLLGSKHWVAAPTVSLSRIKLMINVDMIGRPDPKRLEISGTRSLAGLREMVVRQNRFTDLHINFPWKIKKNSDHYSFYKHDIPILLFHTGLHGDYHRPSDDAHKIQPDGVEQVVRLMFPVVVELADRRDLGEFRPLSKSESDWEQRQFERQGRAAPPRFGASWQGDDQPGIRLKRIGYNSPAHRAGLQVGDRILKIGDVEVTDQHQFHTLIVQSVSATQLEVKRSGEEDSKIVDLKLNGAPIRVGIAWRHSDAEPGVMMLIKVIPGSLGARAGLQIHDRILEVNGKAYTDSDDFQHLMKSLSGRTDLLIERNGRLSKVVLELLENPASDESA